VFSEDRSTRTRVYGAVGALEKATSDAESMRAVEAEARGKAGATFETILQAVQDEAVRLGKVPRKRKRDP
jgi:hypothetical protein